ncbi:MAG: insulinase family protein [Gammaproteobacteria bacterium]|nr:insulinase family protein [Gammaproteobacteria bacterium]
MLHKFSWLLLLSLWLTACSQTHETTLDNGLRVIVHEDHRSPVVVSQIWYKVGSQDEPEGLTGVSHVLEHMMFKGTAKLKPNEFSRIIAENGGRENAFTSYDYTAYFQQLEKSRLPIAFELEADRMQNLVLTEADFSKEIKVVMEERRLRTEDQPEALVGEKFMSTAYEVHPYKHPVIGWMADLQSMTVKNLRDWYGRYYTPANAILVVTGDVKPKEVFTLARKHFGPVPTRPPVTTAAAAEPPQKSERRSHAALPAEVPYLLLGYHAPVHASAGRNDVAEWEPYALSILGGVLDGGQAARFERELVREKKIASSIDIDYSATSRSPSMLLIEATPVNGHTTVELEKAIRAQIERIRNEPVSAEELKRVKAQVVAGNVYSRDSVFYQAMQIGRLAAVGLDWRMLDDYVKNLNAVTAEQVQAVARKYLVDTNLTVAVLDPQPMGKDKPRRAPRMRGGDVR